MDKQKKTTLLNDKSRRDAFFFTVRQIIGHAILATGTALYVADKINQGNETVNAGIAAVAVGFVIYFTTKR